VLVRGQELTPALGEIRGVLAITSHLLLDQLDQSRRPIVACLVQHGNGSRPQLLKFWLPRALLRIIFAHRQRDGHRGGIAARQLYLEQAGILVLKVRFGAYQLLQDRFRASVAAHHNCSRLAVHRA